MYTILLLETIHYFIVVVLGGEPGQVENWDENEICTCPSRLRTQHCNGVWDANLLCLLTSGTCIEPSWDLPSCSVFSDAWELDKDQDQEVEKWITFFCGFIFPLLLLSYRPCMRLFIFLSFEFRWCFIFHPWNRNYSLRQQLAAIILPSFWTDDNPSHVEASGSFAL